MGIATRVLGRVIGGTFGLTHSSQAYSPPGTNVRYGSDVLGIPGTNLGGLPEGGGMPNFNINGYEFYGEIDDSMAVLAVWSEPLSHLSSRLTGKFTGNFEGPVHG